jgi:hypothetical protein
MPQDSLIRSMSTRITTPAQVWKIQGGQGCSPAFQPSFCGGFAPQKFLLRYPTNADVIPPMPIARDNRDLGLERLDSSPKGLDDNRSKLQQDPRGKYEGSRPVAGPATYVTRRRA